MERIIKYIPNINITNNYNCDALSRACEASSIRWLNLRQLNLAKIKFLLAHKINLNTSNDYGKSALMLCCERIGNEFDDDETLELLIHAGADVSARSYFNRTAYDHVTNKQLLSPRLAQLLQGVIRLNRTERASQ